MACNSDNYLELCRLCASYDAIKMEIFGEEGKERNLVEKIQTCLPFQVNEGDQLPKSLCYRCMYMVENFYDFREGCLSAVAMLETCVKHPSRQNSPAELKLQIEQSHSMRRDGLHLDSPDIFMPRLEPQFPVTPMVVRSNHAGPDAMIDISDDAMDLDKDCQIVETRQSKLSEDKQTEDKLGDGSQRVTRTRSQSAESLFCQECDLTFSTKGTYSQHMSKCHSTQHKCGICSKWFTSLVRLTAHLKVHSAGGSTSSATDPRPYSCDLCDKSYASSKHLWGHVSASHKGDPAVTCGLCSRVFSARANLEEHRRTKHDDRALRQEGQAQGGAPPSLLKQTLLRRKRSPSPDEEERPAANRRKSSKPRKIARYELPEEEGEEQQPGSRQYSCLLCDKTFSQRNALSRHFNACHGIDPTELGEPVWAGTETASRQQQQQQQQPPDSEFYADMEAEECWPGLSCEMCSRQFGDRSGLWLHMLYTHKEQAALACGICLKVFGDTSQLGAHWRREHAVADPRRYVCAVCGRQHDSRKKLMSHAAIHGSHGGAEVLVVTTGQEHRPLQPQPVRCTPSHAATFRCELCPKSFPSEDGLVKHKKGAHRLEVQALQARGGSGTYQLLFMCEMCGSSHPSKSDRWRHVFRQHRTEEGITCDHQGCDKVFSTRALRQEHSANHHALQGQIPNTCEVCGKLWGTRVDFWKHLMGVHPDCVPLTCGVCLKMHTDVPSLATHVREKHWPLPPTGHPCDICGRPYANRSKLSRHRKIHEYTQDEPGASTNGLALLKQSYPLLTHKPTEDPHSSKADLGTWKRAVAAKPPLIPWCDACPELNFDSMEQLAEHRRGVHLLQPCDLCPKFYGRTSHLWKHVKRVHRGRPEVTCQICQKVSMGRAHLASHMTAKHSNPETEDGFKCHSCSRTFSKRLLHKNHVKLCRLAARGNAEHRVGTRGRIPVTRSLCDICQLPFRPGKAMESHVRSAHASFPCDLCSDLHLTTKGALMDHVRESHTGHEDLTCSVCNKLLRTKAECETHRTAHARCDNPPLCPVCGDIDSDPARMWGHINKNHGGERPRVCSVCFKLLPSVERLIAHSSARHPDCLTGANTCNICCKSYSSVYKVMDHVNRHHDGYVACKECLAVFPGARYLRPHLVEKHGKEPDATLKDEKQDMPFVVEEISRENMDSPLPFSPLVCIPGAIKTERRTGECPVCGECWPWKEPLWQHLSSSHPGEASTACGLCLVLCPGPGALSSHLDAVHPDRLAAEWACKVCGRIDASEKEFASHARMHEEVCVSRGQLGLVTPDSQSEAEQAETPKPCTVADVNELETLKPPPTATDDSDSNEDQEINKSVLSRVEATGSPTPDRITAVATPPPPQFYICDVCSLVFASEKGLSSHKTIHDSSSTQPHSIPGLPCGSCGLQFESADLLVGHIRSEHNNKGEELGGDMKPVVKLEVKKEVMDWDAEPVETSTNSLTGKVDYMSDVARVWKTEGVEPAEALVQPEEANKPLGSLSLTEGTEKPTEGLVRAEEMKPTGDIIPNQGSKEPNNIIQTEGTMDQTENRRKSEGTKSTLLIEGMDKVTEGIDKSTESLNITEEMGKPNESSILTEGTNQPAESSILTKGTNQPAESSILTEGTNMSLGSLILAEGTNMSTESLVLTEGTNMSTESSVLTEGTNMSNENSILTDGTNMSTESAVLTEGTNLSTESPLLMEDTNMSTESSVQVEGNSEPMRSLEQVPPPCGEVSKPAGREEGSEGGTRMGGLQALEEAVDMMQVQHL